MSGTQRIIRLHDFFAALFSEGFIELRALSRVDRGFFPASDPTPAKRFLAAHRHKNLVFGVAVRRDGSGGDLANCLSLSALFVDVNFKDIHDAEARERLVRFRLPATEHHQRFRWRVTRPLAPPRAGGAPCRSCAHEKPPPTASSGTRGRSERRRAGPRPPRALHPEPQGGRSFWGSVHGQVRCLTCYPPAAPELVAASWGGEPA